MKFTPNDLAVICLTRTGPVFPAVVRKVDRRGEALQLEVTVTDPRTGQPTPTTLYRSLDEKKPRKVATYWWWTAGGIGGVPVAEFLTMGPWLTHEAAREELRPYQTQASRDDAEEKTAAIRRGRENLRQFHALPARRGKP